MVAVGQRGESRLVIGLRKGAAAVIIILGLVVYALAIAWLGTQLPQHWAIDLIFYPVAGFLWILPAAKVVVWAQRPR